MTTTTNSSNKVKISGAEAIIHCLLAEGVNLIYGYPGGAIMPVYDELYKFQDKLTHILTRHEQGATHAAQGYARVSTLDNQSMCYCNFRCLSSPNCAS